MWANMSSSWVVTLLPNREIFLNIVEGWCSIWEWDFLLIVERYKRCIETYYKEGKLILIICVEGMLKRAFVI